MDRDEALRFLGLNEGASKEEIKLAYREMSQILHPDRFANNEKLKERATENFKTLNEARDVLLSGKRSRSAATSATTDASANTATGGTSYIPYNSKEAVLNARLSGISTARIAIIKYQDAEEDSRRNGFILVAIGLLLTLATRRFPVALAIGSTCIIWGIVKVANSQMNLSSLKRNLKELDAEKKQCLDALDELGAL